MARMQFEYDEQGGTFFYFLLTFLAFILLPATFYFWPRKESKDRKDKRLDCDCEPCQGKNHLLQKRSPAYRFRQRLYRLILIAGWVVFFLIAYKCSTLEHDHVEYDPYAVLEIDRGSSTAEIKKAYRKLSLVYHPDKDTGDPKKFMMIAKAYAALTDEESRKNWEEYGNPDGPGATRFGIALPRWIVDDKNSILVLGVYAFAFLIILPVAVGTWWYRSIQYSGDQVLMDTQQLYFYFLHKTSNMIVRRVLMVLAASFEFDKEHNSEIQVRPSDNEEIPLLLKELPSVNPKNKERPLCYPYSVKARSLIHAHLTRLQLPPKTLDLDKQCILKKCPYLLNELVNIVSQLVAMYHAGRVQYLPRLETVENIMKVSQLVVQALWDNKSPLLQLPHIAEDMLRHFTTKRRNIRTLRDLAAMKEEDRKSLLRNMTSSDHRDILSVLKSMPHVRLDAKCEVLDDEDNTVTTGAIVTVTCELVRQSLIDDDSSPASSLATINGGLPLGSGSADGDDAQISGDEKAIDTAKDEPPSVQPVTHSKIPKPWEKNKKKGQKKGGKNKPRPKPVQKPLPNNVVKKPGAATNSPSAKSGGACEDVPLLKNRASSGLNRGDDSEADAPAANSEDEAGNGDVSEQEDTDAVKKKSSGAADDEQMDDEESWSKFQEEARRENSLDTKAKESHLVHCPYFPMEKQECWWLYVCDRRTHQLISAPTLISSLKEREEIQLKFSAPPKPGVYHYTVCLRSDSYLDCDVQQQVRFEVKEANPFVDPKQWDISDEEDIDGDKEEGSDEGSDVSDSEEADSD